MCGAATLTPGNAALIGKQTQRFCASSPYHQPGASIKWVRWSVDEVSREMIGYVSGSLGSISRVHRREQAKRFDE